MSANAYLEEIVRSFAEVQTNLLLLTGDSSATEEQKFAAGDLQESLEEIENDELKALKGSFV